MFSLVLSFEKPISPTYLYYTSEKGLVNYIELFKNKDENNLMKIYN
jgi:hypothetical protein